ncbi:MAG: retroviral-like aspartic protease family protein [Pseudomonadota bacterium]|jgi:clan AA aspartic protease (TIGR02281 family)|nr:clan AA aspartic protease [Sphingomonas sp.]MDQ3483176.1 retroviral-like aspartic protease family protein [Pseudomonadota bacterium]
MHHIRALALAALVLVGACRQEPAPAPDYRPGEAGTVDHALCLLGFSAVPVREISTGHHLVQATINGRRGEFVLDTGANMTVIDTSHLRNFGLSPNSGAIGGAVSIGGGGQARRLSIDSFTVGGIPVRQSRVVTSDLGQLLATLSRVAGIQVNGIIGQDVLNEHRAIIDVARPMLYLIEADEDPRPVPAERCQSGSG